MQPLRPALSCLALSALFWALPLSAQTLPGLGKCSSFYPAGYTLPEGRLSPTPISILKPLKGQVVSEPNFGTCLVRGTDHANEAPATFARNDYSRRQAFNADSSQFIVYSYDGSWHLYDANTFQHVKKLAGLAGDAEPHWDASNPNKLFYVPTNGGTQLLALDTATNQSTVVVNFSGRLPSWATNARRIWTKSEGSPSADGRYWGFQVEDANFNMLGYITWDIVEDRMIGSMQSSARPDHVSMAPSGRWFTISGNGTWAWSMDFSQKKKLHNLSEHSDIALLPNGHDAYVAVDYQSNAGDIFFTDIDACPSVAAAATTAPICERTVLFQNYINGAAGALHVSGKGYRKPGWVVVSMYSDSPSRDGTRAWYHNKVFLTELRANPRIYPLAYTHRAQPSSDAYWSEPHASTNRDLTRVIFNSNWEVASATDLDAYVVHIPQDSFGDRTPTTPTCTRRTPNLTVTGGTTAVAAGSVVTYTATLRNQDSAECAATTFTLVGGVPSGWTSVLPTSTVSLTPGGSTTATWQVNSPGNAAAGTHALTLGSRSTFAEHTFSASAQYLIQAPAQCTRRAPSLAVTGTATSALPGGTVSYQVRLTNQDSAACSATAFTLAGSGPTGWNRVLGTTSLNLAAGATGTTTLSLTVPTTATAGNYTVGAGSASTQGAIHTASASASATVTAPPASCVRKAPSVVVGNATLNSTGQSTYAITLKNQDSAACASTYFGIDVRPPQGSSGWGLNLVQGGKSVAAGATWTTSVVVTPPSNLKAGSYSLPVLHSSQLAIHTGTVYATFIKRTTGGPGQPRITGGVMATRPALVAPKSLATPVQTRKTTGGRERVEVGRLVR